MSKVSTELASAFRAAALRPTPQRYAVLEFLVRRSVHATADEIFHAVNRSDPRASRATVYNSLRLLTRAGLVREVGAEGKAARYDANLHRHYHFLCERCGAVEDIPWFDLSQAAAKAILGGRVVHDCEIVFRGACERCNLQQANAGEKI
ncbi:MAG TPA: transcriptional repressor [Bryobacteraceae bacterium]|nr:transcriptional repressor [Bryobacteraceae bacterium]